MVSQSIVGFGTVWLARQSAWSGIAGNASASSGGVPFVVVRSGRGFVTSQCAMALQERNARLYLAWCVRIRSGFADQGSVALCLSWQRLFRYRAVLLSVRDELTDI